MDGKGKEFSLTLGVGGEKITISGEFPAPGSSSAAMVPLLLPVGGTLLDASEKESAAEGAVPSCGPGCGACCRQLVPISLTEAAYLRDEIIPGLDGEFGEKVRARIADAKERLEASGMREVIDSLPQTTNRVQRQSAGLRYFLLKIPCPFLENESCGIHPVRPFACREYLVSSPAVRCAKPDEGGIVPLPVKVKPSHALIRADAAATGTAGWIPMISALISGEKISRRNVGDPEMELETFLSNLSRS